MTDIDTDAYIRSLENALIFMCATYEARNKVVHELLAQGNNAIWNIPMIQGSQNTVPITQLAKLEQQMPELSLQAIRDIIVAKRKTT